MTQPAGGKATAAPWGAAVSAQDIDWIRLIRSQRVGPVTFHRLIARFGSAAAALDALPEIAQGAGLREYRRFPIAQAWAEVERGRRAGARLLRCDQPGYPSDLANLNDAPPLLWLLGEAEILARPMVALVGARNASSLGLRMARKLSAALAEAGFCVVSGLARGIDAAAHDAALPGATIAVHAGGVDVIYPPENTELAARIGATGCRLSEQPPGQQPQARHFPARNRIIAGLARAVVVVEAAARSGSLITARLAAELGRDVLAVPGHPFDARAGGCNILIRDGATLARGIDDILEALAPVLGTAPLRPAATAAASAAAPAPPSPGGAGAHPTQSPRALTSSASHPTAASSPGRSLAETAALHRRILDRLGPTPTAEDQLIRDLALPAARVADELLELELDGKIERQPGGLLARRH